MDQRCSIRRILTVDDDPRQLEACKRSLRGRYIVLVATSPVTAKYTAKQERPDAAIVDLRLGGTSGIELIKALKHHQPALRVALMSSYLSAATASEALRAGADEVFAKSLSYVDVVRRLESFEDPPTLPDVTPSLARYSWEYIQQVLFESGGNVSAAARRLGILRPSLQRKLRKAPPDD